MKARVDGLADADDKNVHCGRPIQTNRAKELHPLAGVPEGSGVYIQKRQHFQAAIPGYQINVISIDPPHMAIYAGPFPPNKIIYDSSKTMNTIADAIPFKDFSVNPISVTIEVEVTITKIWPITPARAIGAPLVNDETVPFSKKANDPSSVESSPLPPLYICQFCHRKFLGEGCYLRYPMR